MRCSGPSSMWGVIFKEVTFLYMHLNNDCFPILFGLTAFIARVRTVYGDEDAPFVKRGQYFLSRRPD